MQNALTISGNNLTLDDIYQVSHKHRPVEIEEKSMELLVNTRKLVFELSGRGVPIYGCNRGVGWNIRSYVATFGVSSVTSHL